ncbi:MAG: DUF4838 domain-containing protein [Thermoguttaceae bacterium]
MRKTTTYFALFLTLVCSSAFCNDTSPAPLYPPEKPPFLTLVDNGTPTATIVIQDKNNREQRWAAQELATYLRRMSGAELKVDDHEPASGVVVLLRIDPTLNPLKPGQHDWAGSRGYRLQTKGNRLEVIGSDGLSVVHGVYGLLERHLGVRWLWASQLGRIIPKQKTVRVGQMDETSIPDFLVRSVGSGPWALFHGANAAVDLDEQPVGVKWRWDYHSFCELIPASKYYDKHPDWWPLVNGKRKRPDRPASHSTQLCTTNPALIAEMTRNLLAVLDKEPDIDVISLSPNDGNGYCECPRCKALDEPGQDWFGRYSKRLAVLNNAIATEVAKRHPNVLVKVGAYTYYLRRPLDRSLVPTKNQIVQVCHTYQCHNHPLESNGCVAGKTYQPNDVFMPNAEFLKVLDDWRKVTDHLFIYEYYMLSRPRHDHVPWPLVHSIRMDMPYYHRIGAEGFYTQWDASTFQRYGMNYYVAAKLAWNTNLDVDQLMTDYCQKAFGPAWQPMLAYFRYMEQAMIDDGRCLSTALQLPYRWAPAVYTDQVMQKAGDLLQHALQAKLTKSERQRVEFFKQGFEESREAIKTLKNHPKSKERWF